jgi:O-antigen ligase
MKELFLTRDSLANKISFYLLAAFLLSLPFDRFYSHLVLAGFAIHTLIHFSRANLKPFLTWRTLALQSVFWVTVISTLYAANRSLAFGDWGLDISIFLIPTLLCINPLDLKKYRQQLLLIFSLGCAATIIYLYSNAIATIRFYHLPLSTLFTSAFTNHNFSEPIDLHATFFSLQLGVALVYTLSVVIKPQRLKSRLFFCVLSLILLCGIIQLSSKSVFAVLFLTINIAFPLFILHGNRRRRFIAISAALTLVIIAIIANSGTLRDRYFNELQTDFKPTAASPTFEPRLVRWQLAMELIKNSPVIGYGTGSEIPLLQQKYFAKKFYNSYLHRLNAHNEYMSFMIRSGIWGLLVYLATLVYGFRVAIRKKDIIFFGFMMLLAVVSLSENLLDADKGVMFYSFFFPFFVFIAEQSEWSSTLSKQHKNLRRMATNNIAVTSLS